MKFKALVTRLKASGDVETTTEWCQAMSSEDAKGLFINRFRNSFVSIECIQAA